MAAVQLALPVTFGAPRWGAASTARACSRVAMYCNAAMPPAYIRLLTSYMRLGPCEVSQGNFKESMYKVDGTPTSEPMTVKPESQVGHIVDTIPESVCEKQSCTVGIGGGN